MKGPLSDHLGVWQKMMEMGGGNWEMEMSIAIADDEDEDAPTSFRFGSDRFVRGPCIKRVAGSIGASLIGWTSRAQARPL